MNQRNGIYRESFHLKLGWKPKFFHLKLQKSNFDPLTTHLERMLGRMKGCLERISAFFSEKSHVSSFFWVFTSI